MQGERGGSIEVHAVVLVRCDDASLAFMGSWSATWADQGFFAIDKPSTLEISDGSKMQLFDVYWHTSDLLEEEKEAWKRYQKEEGNEYLGNLPNPGTKPNAGSVKGPSIQP
ncbi:hypothetical protein TWF481_010699 [Arthrobotrys musiformis]|uniref:Peptidase C1A papain C-terminal domain-containing protein n=1 Tax=Arthrobotrys musiformis TaxID=47236 RepID=A0AAV9W1N0_9PEZI